jgi:hypothetical protein
MRHHGPPTALKETVDVFGMHHMTVEQVILSLNSMSLPKLFGES